MVKLIQQVTRLGIETAVAWAYLVMLALGAGHAQTPSCPAFGFLTTWLLVFTVLMTTRYLGWAVRGKPTTTIT